MYDVFVLDGSEDFKIYHIVLKYFSKHSVIVESDTNKAIKTLERGKYDLAVISRATGKLNMVQLVEKFRKLKKPSKCLVIFLSSNLTECKRSQSILRGLPTYSFSFDKLDDFELFLKGLNK